jgi:hypothetical protein
MFLLRIPFSYESERRYIIDVLFREFLGLDYQIQLEDRCNVQVTSGDDKQLLVTDVLFSMPEELWLQPASLPVQPLEICDLNSVPLKTITISNKLPIIYGDNSESTNFFQLSENKIRLGIDIFGSAFFMLTRYEEIIKQDRDKHNRFPAKASLSFQEDFLHRPIINEYLEILWACLKQLWPRIERRKRDFKVYVSHDVDEAFIFTFSGISNILVRSAEDILKRRMPFQAIRNLLHWFRIKKGGIEEETYKSLDMVMDISEQNNLRSTFYFITDQNSTKYNGIYNIEHPLIRFLLSRIHQRGHEIGLHTSYNAYLNPAQTKREFQRLKQTCFDEKIEQCVWGNRQHCLRWETPATLQILADVGLTYDTTLSFADFAGFRCGVCYEYPIFNVVTRQPLKISERPLIVMECTVLDKRYMNLGQKDDNFVLSVFKKYKDLCKAFNGDFTLLWHNNRLIDKREIELYKQILKE